MTEPLEHVAPTPSIIPADHPQHRLPRIRYVMEILVPEDDKTSRVIVREGTTMVGLSVRKAGTVLDLEFVNLSLPEARQLADHLHRMCRRITQRKSFMP